MKTNLLKYYIASLYFCSTIIMVAQPGINDEVIGDLEGLDEPAAPVDVYVWVLAAIGLVFVFLRLKAFVLKQTH